MAVAQMNIDGIKTTQNFLIVPDDKLEYDCLLGYDFIKRFTMTLSEDEYTFTERNNNVNIIDQQLFVYNIIETPKEIDVDKKYEEEIKEIINECRQVKEKLSCPVKMEIIPDNFVPFRQSPSRLPPQQQETVKQQVADWIDKGVVRASSANSVSRVVVTKKKDNSYRVCIDYRKLNSMVMKDVFPVPLIDDVLEKLQTAVYFSNMDLENGFFHVPIAEESKKFTAFITKEGTFEFNFAPFGFCNSPAAFIKYVNFIFQPLINENFMELYMDDIIVFSETIEEHFFKLKKVLQVAASYGLKMKWKKCSFLKTKIDFLGHSIEGGVIRPSTEKTRAVEKFQKPKNIRAVQSFLGLTGYFRKFIKNYAQLAKPLTNLLRKDAVFNIGEAETLSIQNLKAALSCEPVLKIYCQWADTELHTDASKDGYGATLLQKFDNQWHPVFYWSKSTSPADEKQHSYILEVKAAYLALKKFRHYLLNKEFKIVTDCVAFKQTTTKKDIPRQVVQWILFFQDFNFSVEHRQNNRMRHVDCLSRYPLKVYTISMELTEKFKIAQHKDDHIRAVTEILREKPYGDYKMKGELVYKTVAGNDLLVVPKAMETEVIRNCHEVGHFALKKTIHAIQQNYFIPHIEKKVQQFINNCIRCIIFNKKLGKKEGYLNCIEKGDKPLETIHIDHLGPMDTTCKQYKYIFVMVDAFSKFVWLFPTKTTNSQEVINKLVFWSEIFGQPERLISDRGAAFTANMFQEYCQSNGIQHVLTTTGVPRGNGQVERVNRAILSVISKLSADEPTGWYKYVGKVQSAINSHVHCSTHFTPFEIMFGTQMRSKIDNNLLQQLKDELMVNFLEHRKQIHEDVKQQIEKAQQMYKNHFDKKRKEAIEYKIGDLVAVKRTQFVAGKKLASEFCGPYKVTKVNRNGRYNVVKVGDFEGVNKTSTSCDYMKRWSSPGIDNYKFSSTDSEELSSETDGEQDGRV